MGYLVKGITFYYSSNIDLFWKQKQKNVQNDLQTHNSAITAVGLFIILPSFFHVYLCENMQTQT